MNKYRAGRPILWGSDAAGTVRHPSLLILALFVLVACVEREDRPTVTVLAAASTRDAIEAVAAEFEATTHIRVRLSSGGSNALAAQIQAGVAADVFVSANARWADVLRDEGLAERMRPLLGNGLVLIVPAGNPAEITSLRDLADGRVRYVAVAGKNVPAGVYAGQALEAAGVLRSLIESGRVVRGHDVRIALHYVALGEAEAGIVYASDATGRDRVEIVRHIDATLHGPIVYPAVLLKRAAGNAEAVRFYEFLGSSTAAGIFRAYGFRPHEELDSF